MREQNTTKREQLEPNKIQKRRDSRRDEVQNDVLKTQTQMRALLSLIYPVSTCGVSPFPRIDPRTDLELQFCEAG
jgi:hypothetical protein